MVNSSPESMKGPGLGLGPSRKRNSSPVSASQQFTMPAGPQADDPMPTCRLASVPPSRSYAARYTAARHFGCLRSILCITVSISVQTPTDFMTLTPRRSTRSRQTMSWPMRTMPESRGGFFEDVSSMVSQERDLFIRKTTCVEAFLWNLHSR